MASTSTSGLVDALRQHRLLPPHQLDQLGPVAARAGDSRVLAKELLSRGWLTSFQINQLLRDRGKELILGSYVLLERLGEGAMGEVYKARHRELDRVVALKVIRKERLANPDAVHRFQREIRAASQLSHRNIVLALDADQVGDVAFYAMEYIEGTDLFRLVRKSGPLPVATACEYVRQAALGLQHAHERGLVHRDIKPSNLMVTTVRGSQGIGVVKILDLGLARWAGGAVDDDSISQLTRDGVVVGTVDYMAPEQATDSHGVDIRADLYSLGATFYYLLTGNVPFPGGTPLEKLVRHRSDEPTPVERLRPDVPADVAAVIRRLLAKRPEDRYQTPAELVAVLGVVQRMLAAPTPATGVVPKVTVAETTRSTAVGPTPTVATGLRRGVRAIVLLCVLMLGVAGLAATLLYRAGFFTRTPTPATATTEAVTRPEVPTPLALFNGKDGTGWKSRAADVGRRWPVYSVALHRKDPTRLGMNPLRPGESGAMTNGQWRFDIYTEQHFGDGTLEFEFMIPKASITAVYLMGEYAIKIADSLGKEPGPEELGAVGGIAPRINAARKPGDWQQLLVEYRAPRFEAGRKVANLRIIRALLNDQLIHDHVDLPAPSPGGLTGKEAAIGPVMIQGVSGTIAIRSMKFTPRSGS
jgi:serine/threonine-protein kinase